MRMVDHIVQRHFREYPGVIHHAHRHVTYSMRNNHTIVGNTQIHFCTFIYVVEQLLIPNAMNCGSRIHCKLMASLGNYISVSLAFLLNDLRDSVLPNVPIVWNTPLYETESAPAR